ncbi:MAG: hypothetical protein AAF821_00015 [Cyanobacteria bacterium P01_D01_bin.156]
MAKTFDCDAELGKLNGALKAASAGVAVKRIGQRLYLRATLPPKPGSNQIKPRSQRIKLSVYANPAGLRTAKKRAFELSNDIASQTFEWANWADGKGSDRTVADWIADFEKDYFTRRKRNPKSQTTWDKDYRDPLRKLSQKAVLTAELLVNAAESFAPDTRARKRAVDAYTAIAKFMKLDVDLKPLRGKYSPKAVSPRDLPSDEVVIEWVAKIPDPEWRTFYCLVATYGLRNHECWYVDLERLKTDPIAIVTEGKTGPRLALPVPKAWWSRWFEGRTLSLPKLTTRCNRDYGVRSSQYFYRLKNREGFPFTIYTLRHAQAARMALAGIDLAFAAKSQGHSAKVHEGIYLNFLDRSHFEQVLDGLQE